MSKRKELASPTEMALVPSNEDEVQELDDGKVRMKKELGLLEGVAIIIGIIFGSGIFLTPTGVIQNVESVGASLVIWVLCGGLSLIGALCYAELGTSIPKSGGDYAYIHEAFGSLPAFLYLWAANLIFVPTTNAIMGLTFAKYVVQPFFPQCQSPDLAIRIVAGLTICFLSFLNSYDVKSTTKLQNFFMFCKIGALVLVIMIGGVWMGFGNVSHFENAFDNTTSNPGKMATAFYSGIFSYSGWNYLNFMTEELKNPYINLPLAIYISLPIVTSIYVLANMAYLSVLTPLQMKSSEAVAVTFGDIMLGSFSWIIPVLVALSAFGGLSVHIMTSSRMLFVGARNGHFPTMLAHINIDKFTPVPSLVFLNILSLLMLATGNVFVLITYCTIVETSFITLSVAAILWLRYKQPNLARPIKVNLLVPILFILVCVFLIVMSCLDTPYEVLMGCLITLLGIPAYYFGVCYDNKPKWLINFMAKATYFNQKLFMSAHEE